MKQSNGGVPIRRVNLTLILLALALAGVFLWTAIGTSSSYVNMQDANAAYLSCQRDASSLMEASDYLTEQVRTFVITGDSSFIDAFYTEVNVTRRRDLALEDLAQWFSDTEAYQYLEEALARSNALIEQENYAMRLAIEARNDDLSNYPEVLGTVTLEPEDAALSPEEQLEKATELVYGQGYQDRKEEIREDVSDCLNTLLAQTMSRQSRTSEHFLSLLRRQTVLVIAMLAIVALLVLLSYGLVFRPLQRISDHIRQHMLLPVEGSAELRYLAATYNVMLEQTQRHQEALSYEAAHDDLTGLYNRGIFDKTRESIDPEECTLILVDVDKFKEINDVYGHDTGDRILKKVATVLQHSFRSDDYVCRIGGDEFAVIMVHAGKNLQQLVAQKMAAANEHLQHPEDGLPPVSLSIGVAFGDRDNPTEDIFKDADAALYRVKNAGRAACAFYGE